MTLPAISVVIPCYNAGLYLAECLTSVLGQTRAPAEVIVVDDGSTDDSCDVARQFPVRLLHTGGRRGHMAGRAIGVAAAAHPYVAMIDADDIWDVDHLESTAALLDRHPEAVLAGSNARKFGTQEGTFEASIPVGGAHDVFWRAFDAWLVSNSSVVIRREALRDALRDADRVNHYSSDFLVDLRLAHTGPFVATGQFTTWWRWHATQMSVNQWRQRIALHEHRAHFLAEVRATEPTERYRQMKVRAAEDWAYDVTTARDDLRFFDELLRVRRLVPAVPLRVVLKAYLRRIYWARMLDPLRRLYRSVRQTLRLHGGFVRS